MPSIVPSAIFVGLGLASVALLDEDAFIPFYLTWCLAGLLLAAQACEAPCAAASAKAPTYAGENADGVQSRKGPVALQADRCF